MTRPMRIQRKRVAGWRMPYNTVCCCRPGKFANPFAVGKPNPFGTITADNRHAVALYLGFAPQNAMLIEAARAELRGKNLACWCALCAVHADGKPLGIDCPHCARCHVDILIEIANDTGRYAITVPISPPVDNEACYAFLALAAAATSGPWSYHLDAPIKHPGSDWGWVLANDGLKVASTHAAVRRTDAEDAAARAERTDPPTVMANGRFVAVCRQMAPALAEEVLRLRAELAGLKQRLEEGR